MAGPPLPRGITLLDLVTAIPQGAQEVIPEGLRRLLEHLSVVESLSRASGAYDIVEGIARSAVDMLGVDVGNGFTAEIPGVTTGLRFSYSSVRVATAVGQNVEPPPTTWQVAIFADRILVPFPGRAAVRTASTGDFVGPLVEDPDRERVHAWISGVVVITNATGSATASIAADPDPFQPDAPSGTIVKAGLEPRHVLFGSSGFGMTVGEVLWDQAVRFTPPEIVVRGHDAAWRGISVSDATLYLPRDLPFVGDITAGVRDLLIGFSPDNGVQLEAFLQMGETSRLDLDDGEAHKVALRFYQDVDGQLADLATPSGPGTSREVTVSSTPAGDAVRVMGRLFPPEAQARWRLPGTTTWLTANDTGWVTVRPGDPHDTLGYRDVFTLEDGTTADGPQITFSFAPDATADDSGFPPKIRVTSEPYSWSGVTHVSGSGEHLAGIRFDAIEPLPALADIERMTWELRHGGATITGAGGHFEPVVSWRPGRHSVVLTDHRQRRRRLEVEAFAEADRMVIGCAFIDGAAPEDERRGPRLLVDEIDEPAVPTAVVGSYHLRSFHQDGEFRPGNEPATLHPLAVPDGTLAELALAAEDDDATHVLSAVRVRMDFDTTTPILYREIHPVDFTADEPGFEGTHVDPWGPADPYPVWNPSDPTSGGADRLQGFPEGADPNFGAAAVLRSWASGVLAVDPAAAFVVIGRTCDIGDSSYNTGLGGRRAAQGRALLTDPAFGADPISSAIVYCRGENEVSGVGAIPADPTILDDLTDPVLRARSLAERTRQEIRIESDFPDRSVWGETRAIPEREEARCFDVYAVVPVPWQPTLGDDDAVAAARRRTLVAGADQWATITEAPRERDLDFALRLLAKWDSPSWVDAQDSAPTLVELALDWENRSLEIPALDGAIEPEPTVDADGESKVWQVVFRFAKDPRSRQMVVSGALDTPGSDEGILRIVDRSDDASGIASDLALTLALGPALATGVDAASVADSVVPLAALAVVAAGSALFDVASNGVVTLHRLEFGYGRAAGGASVTAANRVWLYADYTAAFDVALPANLVTGTGVAVRYRRAGIELGYNASPANLDSLGLVYEETAEVVTPGTWTMSNVLARLIGIAAVRMGAGSIWFEVDLVLVISLGPITLEEATLRLTLSDPVLFELRGLTVSIDVPGVVQGEGQLAITVAASGLLDVSARLDIAIEPIGLQIDAAFRYEDPMAHLEIAVTFATAIPILGTGLGLFGLQGRFVSNGTRDLASADVQPDPVQRELAWLETPLLQKYTPLPGQIAIGLGATVGTQPDGGFTFNINGMIAVEFPDPSVVLTVAGRFMSFPEGAEEVAGSGSTTTAGLLGIVAISGDGIAVGIRGTYGVPKVLDVQIPIAAWFPFKGDLAGYVRVGSDGFSGRAGDPVTITVLPGTLDLKAWSYLMIEQKALPNLGGKGEDWDFTGFSIGFGAGYDFEWGGKAVYLRAGSSIVVGLGTKPLFIKGELTTGGELRFGPVGVSIDGNVLLTLTTDNVQLSGEFCGEVDLALFKAKGCVHITIGGAAEPAIEPDPLVAGLSLTRYARVVGAGGTAWVDCRPTLHFSKRVINALDSTSFQPTPSNGWGADWGGSARTKFLYRLVAVELLDGAGAVITDSADWPSSWWIPAGRPAIPAQGDAPSSEHEMWDLALLAWDPAPWARSLLDGGADTEGDPATMIERLCDPIPETTPHCVFGADGVRLSPGRVKFAAAPTGELPWRSGASLAGTETLGLALDAELEWGRMFGYRYVPGGVVSLPTPFTDPDSGFELRRSWRLPRFTHVERDQVTVGFHGTFSADVEDPDLVIALSLPVPTEASEFEACYPFEDLGDGPEVPPLIDYGLIRITGQTFIDSSVLDGYWLVFRHQLDIDIGMSLGAFTYGPATRVEATVKYVGSEPINMRAFDGDGTLLAEARLPDDVSADVAYTLVITRAGIERVELWADPAPAGVTQRLLLDTLCLQVLVSVDPDLYRAVVVGLLESSATLLAPTCAGLRTSSEQQWSPSLLGVVASDRRVAALVRYRPDVDDAGPWNGARLDPVPVLEVGIVSSCFTTTAAVEAAAAADQAGDDILDQWNSAWNASEDARVVLLDAAADYQVRVRYDVATWNQDDVGGPPSAASLDWDAPPSTVSVSTGLAQTFDFHTAADTGLAESDLLRFDVQDAFDPRALARYVIGFDPTGTTPRHFLDDALLVHFEVEWIGTLLGKYGYELALDVVRTDPPPGMSTGVDDRLVASTVTWGSNTSTMQSSMADARMAVAALLAPCVDGANPHGVTASIAAELEPLAEYDLIVNAAPAVGFQPSVVIARTHFATSAFRDADELLAALGFDRHAPSPDPVFALEQIVDAPAPADVVLADDVALDAALATLGLDPLPVPDTPAMQLLWIDDGGWKIAAVLLDSLEALQRPPRLEDVLDDSPPGSPTVGGPLVLSGVTLVAVTSTTTGEVVDYVEPPDRLTLTSARVGSVSLTPRRSNASATRVLFVPDAPFVPASADPVVEVAWTDRGNSRLGRRFVPTVPRLVSQEWT